MPKSLLTDELRQLLQPYTDLFGDLTDEQIAEQLELEPRIVAAYRASLLDAGAAPSDGPAHAPEGPPSPGEASLLTPEQQRRAEAATVIAAEMGAVLETYIHTGAAPGGAPLSDALAGVLSQLPPEEAVSTGSSGPIGRAPRSVRVKKKGRVRGPDGRSWVLAFRDVYNGEQAAWLWENHHAFVEPYPTR